MLVSSSVAPCRTAESSSVGSAAAESLPVETPLSVAVGQEVDAAGSACAREKASALAHNRMTPSGDPVSVYLQKEHWKCCTEQAIQMVVTRARARFVAGPQPEQGRPATLSACT